MTHAVAVADYLDRCVIRHILWVQRESGYLSLNPEEEQVWAAELESVQERVPAVGEWLRSEVVGR